MRRNLGGGSIEGGSWGTHDMTALLPPLGLLKHGTWSADSLFWLGLPPVPGSLTQVSAVMVGSPQVERYSSHYRSDGSLPRMNDDC